MEVGTAHSGQNPNESWLDSRGSWLTYVILIAVGHLCILSVPFFETPTAWTLTNTAHNVVSTYNISLLVEIVSLVSISQNTFKLVQIQFISPR